MDQSYLSQWVYTSSYAQILNLTTNMKKNQVNLINWYRCQLYKSLSVVFLMLIPILGFAQTRITGKVRDVNGDALIGVTVIVSNVRQGTITDVNGGFQLTVSDRNAIIEFSYVGYQTVDVPLDGRTYLEVTLEEDSELLEEVVVVGY